LLQVHKHRASGQHPQRLSRPGLAEEKAGELLGEKEIGHGKRKPPYQGKA
jgi:hypothetical protein